LLADRGASFSYGALRLSISNNHVEVVRFLLDWGADLRIQNGGMINLAAAEGHTDIVKLLIDRGADISGNHYRTLTNAAQYGHTQTVKFLFEKGSQISQDALDLAIINNHTEVIKLLHD
jgi:ankyrin repeat protein